MAEGLTVIAAGLAVVLCIMASMFVLIEVILKIDQVLRDRAERASAGQEAREAEAARGQEPKASPGGDEVIAAIGLALQQHLARRVAPRSATAGTGAEPTPWASSGRLEIMTERQRVTSRRS
jgi:Na+-transporting methylmalonyl-CoA/oxaloacetate decarboxylase gamma subunit